MLIDIHTHAFHDKIADKVIEQLKGHYGIQAVGTGTISDLLEKAGNAGLDKVVVFNAATDKSQVIPANNFTIHLQETYPEVISFGTMHVDYPEQEKELARLRRNNIAGLKIHCDFQGFFMDDPRLIEFLEMAVQDFVVMFHVGDVLPPEKNPSCPFKFAKLMRHFPDARFIAAHMGGFRHWKWALESIIGGNAYIDTSSTLDAIDDETLHAIWNKHPRERILFGSDYPLFDPGQEAVKLQQRLHLSDSELEDVMTNASRLLNLALPGDRLLPTNQHLTAAT